MLSTDSVSIALTKLLELISTDPTTTLLILIAGFLLIYSILSILAFTYYSSFLMTHRMHWFLASRLENVPAASGIVCEVLWGTDDENSTVGWFRTRRNMRVTYETYWGISLQARGSDGVSGSCFASCEQEDLHLRPRLAECSYHHRLLDFVARNKDPELGLCFRSGLHLRFCSVHYCEGALGN